MAKYIIALDAGTTSTRALLINKTGEIKGLQQKEFSQIYPREGWVEHDAMEILSCQFSMMTEVMVRNSVIPSDIAGLGITNQRETVVVWDKKTGRPVYNAIVWQCRRTSDYCEELKNSEYAKIIQEKTGLRVDAYFSATKIKWILDNVEGARKRAINGDLLAGTIDTWLLWNLTGKKIHVTDFTNASRTMLFNIKTLEWDQTLLDLFDIPRNLLPEVKNSSEIYGTTDRDVIGGEIPIAGIVGDQQGALVGHLGFKKGSLKNTYGTGCFMLLNTGKDPVFTDSGLLTTITPGLNGQVNYALEGSVFMAGGIIQWLRDELEIIRSASETEAIARSVPDTAGAYLVSSFQGLGTPYWDMAARGAIVGLSRAVTKKHIVRAALESIAYRTNDVLKIMERETGINMSHIRVDGGASRNNFLLQFQSDISDQEVWRPANVETTAMGAGYLAGMAVGFWTNVHDLEQIQKMDKIFKPDMDSAGRKKLYSGWKLAVESVLSPEKK